MQDTVHVLPTRTEITHWTGPKAAVGLMEKLIRAGVEKGFFEDVGGGLCDGLEGCCRLVLLNSLAQ